MNKALLFLCCLTSNILSDQYLFPFSRGKAILIRQKEDDAVAGLFSQIGELYVVHHIWGECSFVKKGKSHTSQGCPHSWTLSRFL